MAKIFNWKMLLAVIVLLAAAVFFVGRSTGLIQKAVYEHEPPALPVFERPAVLVLSKANGFVHKEAMPAAEDMLRRIAQARGWDIFITANAAVHNTADLARFKVVVWNNVSGDVLTEPQRTAMQNYIEQGGGWVGIHGAGGDPKYRWRWYVDTLIGAQFVGHTMHPQFQDADVLVASPQTEITAHLPSPWRIPLEEWYAFDSNPRDKGYEILLAMDQDSYLLEGESFFGNDTMDGEHPITWRHRLGEGRVFYTAIGHQAATYRMPAFEQLVAQALQWAGDMPALRVEQGNP